MEKSQFESSLSFPHRHLKSGTYRTLVQILSHCHGHSQVSSPTETRPEICEPGELNNRDITVLPENYSVEKDKVVDESFEAIDNTQRVIDEIDNIMQIEESGDLLKQKAMVVSDSAEPTTGYKDTGCDPQQMLMDELEHIVKGNGKLVQENSGGLSAASVGKNQSGVVALTNDREEHLDIQQIVIEESGNEAQLQVDEEHCNLKIDKPFGSSSDRSTDYQVSKPSEDKEDQSFSVGTNAFEAGLEMPEKDMELEKLVDTNGTMSSCDQIAEDVEVEEGEISGEFQVDEESDDMLDETSAVLEENNVDEKQISEDVIDKREFPCNEQIRANDKLSESTSLVMNGVGRANCSRPVELKESIRNEKQSNSKNVSHGASMMAIDAEKYNCVPEARNNKRKLSGDEADVGFPTACLNNLTNYGDIYSEEKPKKKRRGALSEEKKAKKKRKDRRKRAEKNRQLGVKRLKLRPVLKPKTVTYCRHYLKGRCQEGDKCKFSHDTIPLTKSQPCCHFARNSCMKGDDCPYDHELSKYPCNNFVEQGFCKRRDHCMFSHKMPSKENAPSEPELKSPSLPHISNSQKQQKVDQISHQIIDSLSKSRKVPSYRNKEPNAKETVLKAPALAPKGISCLFLGKSSVLESSKQKQGSSSPKRNDSGNLENQTENNASVTVPNMIATPKQTVPAVASKGVNFLSFGNMPSEDSSGKKLASLLLNKEDGIKSSLFNNFSMHKQDASPLNGENSVKQTTQSVSSTIDKSNEMMKKTQPAVAPRGMNFVSIGKAVADGSENNKQASLPSILDSGINRSLEESQNTPHKHQNSSTIPWRPSPSPFASGQSSELLTHGHHKGTPASAQKSLMSTLAFASKFGSQMKINRPAVSNAVNNGTTSSSTGGSHNDTAKASKILEFLSGISSKSQQ